jgi:hypothetical protein
MLGFRAIPGASVPGRQDCAQSIIGPKDIGHFPFAFIELMPQADIGDFFLRCRGVRN